MIKVHYRLGGGPFDDEPTKNKTYTTKDPHAHIEFLEVGWILVLDKTGQELFAIQSHAVQYIEGKNELATEG